MKLILTIAIAILQGMIAIIPSKGKLFDNRSRFPKNIKGLGWSLITCCVLTIISTAWIYVIVQKDEKFTDEEKSKVEKHADSVNNAIIKKQDTIKIFADSLDNMQKTIIALESSQLDTAKSILNKQNLIIESQSEQFKNLVGNGSLPQVIGFSKNNLINFALINNSNYPIMNIELSIVGPLNFSLPQLDSLSKITITDENKNPFKNLNKDYNIGSLKKHAGYITNDVSQPIKNSGSYICGVSWLYGSYTARISYIKIRNSFMIDSTVYLYNNGNIFKFPNSILK